MKKALIMLFMAVIVLISLLYGFQEKQQLFPPERHEVEVRLIMVDVIVTRDGEFVKDLTKEDFELFEDRIRVPINSFELVSFDKKDLKLPEEMGEGILPVFPQNRIVVIFDAINSWQREIIKGSEKIIDELVSIAKLGNEVMVLQLRNRKGIEIIQPFTLNEELIKNSVEKASGSIWRLGTVIEPSYKAQVGSEGRTESPTEIRRMRETDNPLESIYAEDMQRIYHLNTEMERFGKTIGGILGACNMIKSLPGRKYMLLISAGIPDLSPPDMLPNILSGILTDRLEDAYRNKSFGKIDKIKIFDPFNILDKKAFKNGAEVITELIRFANAHNISIYSLDCGTYVKRLHSGASAEFFQKNEMAQIYFREGDNIRKVQNLRWISEDTGADSLRGADKFEEFRKVISRDLTYYYQLSFYAQRSEADDKYHKIEVNVKRQGVDTKFRKGYMDYSKKETNKMLLVTAFYNPSLFKELPFKAEIIPFLTESGKYEPWMNIALPAKELFRDRFIEYAPKLFNLHVWIKDKNDGEKGYGGKINIGLNISPSCLDFVKNIDYLSYHFKGPEFNFGRHEYQIIFALFDPQTNEIGTWESSLFVPVLKQNNERLIINCVLGDTVSNSKKAKTIFLLSKKDGSLESDQIKFFPKVTNQFKKWEGASVFMQLYLPHGKTKMQPEFLLLGEDRSLRALPKVLLSEFWNEKLKVWSSIFKLELDQGTLGENSLYVEIPESEEGALLSKKMKLTIIR
ncbi:MAG: VWA domain-containing protein [Candidatus Aminicenantes bacterium]|nr:VWA domain-containing protein [Candidatus Aminicenantes bacterium]